MGVGTADADADARSTRAKLEADTHKMNCESQRRRERLGVSMLNPLGRSACGRKGYQTRLSAAAWDSNGHGNVVCLKMRARAPTGVSFAMSTRKVKGE